jgi:hypothetical protein
MRRTDLTSTLTLICALYFSGISSNPQAQMLIYNRVVIGMMIKEEKSNAPHMPPHPWA